MGTHAAVLGSSRGRIRLLLAWVLLAVGLAAAVPAADATPAQAPPNYSNWLFNGDNPSVMKTGTAQAPVYYVYVSGFDFAGPIGARVFRSTDMATWESVGNALPVATAGTWANRSSGWNFSSPSVREIGTNPVSQRYVMYFTGLHATTGNKCIGVATSSSPAGPFVGAANPLICPSGGAQDPSAVVLPDGLGFQEVVYSRTSGPDAGIYNQVLTQDGLALHQSWSPLLLYKPMPNWWHEGIVDRPQLVGDGQGNAYLFFGAGTPNTTSRATGWAPCTHLGIVTNCQNQTVLGTWFEGSNQVKALGGVQTFLDAQGNNWIVYRGHTAGACQSNGTCNGTPSVYLDRLCFSHGHPRTNAPTTGSQSTARSTDCGADIPAPALSVASVNDDPNPSGGTSLVSPNGPIYLDGMSSAAIGGKVLWTFGDTPCPNGQYYSKTAGFGVPNAAADGPNFVQHKCAAFLPMTADEAAYQAAHASCTPPAGGQCEIGRFVFWGPVIGLDGSGVAIFSKVWMRRIRQWSGGVITTGPETPLKLGVGLARIPAASIAADNPVVDRSRTASPNACNPASGGGATAAGCLFDESVAPTNSDRFWRPYVEGGYLYLFSDWSWEGGFSNTKLVRAPLGDINNKSAWLYWKGPGPGDWSTTYTQAADVPGASAAGLQAGSISFNPYLNKYINTWADWGDAISIQTADSLTGPWTALQPLHNQVECPDWTDPQGVFHDGHSYAGGLHPELASDGGRILTMTYIQVTNGPCVGKSRIATINLG